MIAGVAAFALLALVFAPTLRWIWDGWFLPTGYYSHGPLLALVAGAVLWARRAPLRRVVWSRTGTRIGLFALAFSLLVHVAGQALMVDALSGFAFVPALLSLVLAREGWPRFRLAAPAIGTLFLVVPLPIFVTGRLAYSMKHLATAAGVWLGNLFGIGLTQVGANIVVPGQSQPLIVGDACSGLRSLVALVALGYIYAFFLTPRRPWGRALFVALAVPIALVANFVRIAGLAVLARYKGVAFASGTAHDVSGYLLYACAIALLYGLDRILPGRCAATRVQAPAGEAAPVRVRSMWPLACLVVLGMPALLLAVWYPGSDGERFAARVPRATNRFVAVEDHVLPEAWYDLLGTRDVCWRTYRHRESGRPAVLTAIFQGRKWKSLHPPEVCLISAGFEITGVERRSVEVAHTPVVLSVLEVERARQRYLVGYAFGGEGFVTPSFLGFFVRNVPRALFRRDTRGFMLRVDVPWPAGRPREQVEMLLSAFLGDFLPEMNRLMKGG